MEPLDLFSTDRVVFDAELDGLISAAAAATSSTSTTVSASSPDSSHQFIPSDPRIRKRAAVPQSRLPERQKVDENGVKMEGNSPSPTLKAQSAPEPQSRLPSSEHNAENVGNHSLHVHPARRVLLDRPDAQGLRDVFHGPAPKWTKTPLNEGRLQRSQAIPSLRDAAKADVRAVVHLRDPTNIDKTWATQRNAVRRQWDMSKDDLAYEALLELRRNEKIDNIDRYVPPAGNARPQRRPAPPRRGAFFPFRQLPEQVQSRILGFVLVSDQPIRIDFTWLRTFVQGHARVPKATIEVGHEGATYKVQVQWDRLVGEVTQMQDDLRPFHFALEERALKTRRTRAPCRGLTTSLLRVSRDVHKHVARVFYGSNTFSFPWATSAWMQLESFLATIGLTNTGYLRSINIHAPLWHLGVHEDYAEGAILDLTSPASRMAVIKPPAADRLLAAIQSSVDSLLQGGSLTTFTLDLNRTWMADFSSERYNKTLITMSDAKEFGIRKQKGIELLKRLSEALPTKPVLIVRVPGRPQWGAGEESLRKAIPLVVAEAEKYGCGSFQTAG
ncbi:hypothetical protein LTR36_003124 [Oleoguttula mirabilis]|uniref:Uncharacterized protein n=1 Tax=Oleoguttula mirabilis TaxID=1507867 RepID=A0AAV9JWN0_9PEZI|nr:hypothetical protein LTR36_003124 [Oleoguttula mirabilis]